MLYEYRCTSCGDQVVTSSNEDAGGTHFVHTDENDCGPLKRVWSVGFTIKSTDWGH